jgi:hypothetical protein
MMVMAQQLSGTKRKSFACKAFSELVVRIWPKNENEKTNLVELHFLPTNDLQSFEIGQLSELTIVDKILTRYLKPPKIYILKTKLSFWKNQKEKLKLKKMSTIT